MIQTLAFYVFAAVTVVSAFMVIAARNPVHSVLYLILAFFNSAALFLLMGAEFIAMILVIVYVGAVAVLFLFVVMMLDINIAELRQGFLKYLPIGAAVGTALFAELLLVLGVWTTSPIANEMLRAKAPDLAKMSNTQALGQLIYTDYLFLFQAAGMVLLVAMIGAIVLTLRTRPGVRRQRIADQIGRRREDAVVLVKAGVGEGVSS
ncbi:NADH-quinone oxidoreductase subunit J [Vineibacter terrae]|uniref:NADH-quinone oxidoreductase subunit J n=1 Tax=Vineibacter terrae TaxID=2586908 RepID=UPI002E30069C|nr:NADH-quinone oxidoreductase subunit J [Vineibacter terrae]HEX2892219.1 NADH-quinone oxidoreductase subunit J [Vineibacter terrae]